MASAPRPKGKATKIAQKIMGIPSNMRDKSRGDKSLRKQKKSTEEKQLGF